MNENDEREQENRIAIHEKWGKKYAAICVHLIRKKNAHDIF